MINNSVIANQYNAAFLVEIHALRILRMTDANDTTIAVFNVEHEAASSVPDTDR
jgi:hypothetical protein